MRTDILEHWGMFICVNCVVVTFAKAPVDIYCYSKIIKESVSEAPTMTLAPSGFYFQ